MDMYGLSAQDCFRIDDLLDFSNDDLFSPSSASASDAVDLHHHLPQLPPTTSSSSSSASAFSTSTDFTNDLSVPSDDVAELEWLSRFVDDSFSDFPTGENVAGLAAAMFPNDVSFSARARSKRSRAPISAVAGSWTAATEVKPKSKREVSSPTEAAGGGVRRCTHCASEKTPQWRTGPMGPKTLCNACGVRYKSGRLVPEYRPAASPTFMLTQHSNSHRKVLELRRQKELQLQRQQQPPPPPPPPEQKQEQFYPHHHGFRVC